MSYNNTPIKSWGQQLKFRKKTMTNSMYIAWVRDEEENIISEFKSTRKSEIKKYALKAIKDGAESVDIHYWSKEFGDSYIGSFYADGEMPRLFNK